MFGFGAGSGELQRALEAAAMGLASADSMREFSRVLASAPRIAGTEAQARTRDYVIEQMRSWGLDATAVEYEAFLPRPTLCILERLTPAPKRFTLREQFDQPAPSAEDGDQWPPCPGYAAAGDVSGQLVYANYGREEDLDLLKSTGATSRGKIALVRYGEIFRGNKVMNLERRGAVGCILYSDPHDDGYYRGDVYPDGPMRPPGSIQRGSLNLEPGDPTLPAASAGVERIARQDATNLPRIPCLAVGYGVAAELLADLRGPEVPREWQGALPFRYHVGPGPVEARVVTADDGGMRKIWNTLGLIVGAELLDEWVILGAHRDSWCRGAADNAAGVAAVMEAARVCAALARDGKPPRRTLVFATWDAEEWGLIGSTKWIEQERQALGAKAVAYLNLDMPVTGSEFGAFGSPALERLVHEALAAVPSPDQDTQSIGQVWRAEHEQPPRLGVPGGGSDHVGFFLHLGIPCVGFGFSGRCGVYHSDLDEPEWIERYADPGYRRHRAVAMAAAALSLRLANAGGLPFDYGLYMQRVGEVLLDVKARAGESPSLAGVSFERLSIAAETGNAVAQAVTAAAVRVDWDGLAQGQRRTFNSALRLVERTLLRPAGDLPNDYHRNLVFGVDLASGYGGQMLPGLAAALKADDRPRLEAEVRLLAGRLEAVTSLLQAAAGALPAARNGVRSAYRD